MTDRVLELLADAGFEVYTRAQWGSPREKAGDYADRRSSHPMPAGPADFHYLHLSVTSDTDTVREGDAGARQIETYGYSSPPMVSYHALVTNEGRIYQGQSEGVRGTHTVNDKNVPGFPHDLNAVGYATALMQNVADAVTDEQVRAIAATYAARELLGFVRHGAPIYPHRKFAWKACPGDLAMARLDEIQNLKDQMVREGITYQEDDMFSPEDRKMLQTLATKVDRLEQARVNTVERDRKVARKLRELGVAQGEILDLVGDQG